MASATPLVSKIEGGLGCLGVVLGGLPLPELRVCLGVCHRGGGLQVAARLLRGFLAGFVVDELLLGLARLLREAACNALKVFERVDGGQQEAEEVEALRDLLELAVGG